MHLTLLALICINWQVRKLKQGFIFIFRNFVYKIKLMSLKKVFFYHLRYVQEVLTHFIYELTISIGEEFLGILYIIFFQSIGYTKQTYLCIRYTL